jgi:hypothetical protein
MPRNVSTDATVMNNATGSPIDHRSVRQFVSLPTDREVDQGSANPRVGESPPVVQRNPPRTPDAFGHREISPNILHAVTYSGACKRASIASMGTKEPGESVWTRLDKPLVEHIDQMAKDDDRTRAYVVRKLIEEGLAERLEIDHE